MDYDKLHTLDRESYVEDFSKTFYEQVSAVFMLIDAMIDNESIDRALIIDGFKNAYTDTLVDLGVVITTELSIYINSYAEKMADATINHIDTLYYTSQDRARNTAENEGFTIWNYQIYEETVKSGVYKTKTWVTNLDGMERESHHEENGTTVPIDDFFVVNGSIMRYPRDIAYGAAADETVNCRCWLDFN